MQQVARDSSYLRDTLLALSSEENSPCDTTGVLALEEEGLGLAILESEDLAVTTDVELALLTQISVKLYSKPAVAIHPCVSRHSAAHNSSVSRLFNLEIGSHTFPG
jgi:hypothetical protein